jgi:hypothetical protein
MLAFFVKYATCSISSAGCLLVNEEILDHLLTSAMPTSFEG